MSAAAPDVARRNVPRNDHSVSDSRHSSIPDHRRRAVVTAAGALAASALARPAWPAADWPAIPALASMLDGRSLQTGRVHLDIPKLADNGNSVPLTITVDSPMTDTDRVVAIHVYSERNPRPRIALIELGPDAGRAELATRIRLAGTQRIVAVAQMADGSLWAETAEVIVTQSACTDDP
jgi:sulfur-oxidizing protein SoxY